MSASKNQSVKRVNNTNTNTNTKTKRRSNNKRRTNKRVATKNKNKKRKVVSNKKRPRRGAKNTTRKNNNVNGRRNGRKGGGALRNLGEDEEPTHMTLNNVQKQIGERQLREALNDNTDSSNESNNNKKIFENVENIITPKDPIYGSTNVTTSSNNNIPVDYGTGPAPGLKKMGFKRSANVRQAFRRGKKFGRRVVRELEKFGSPENPYTIPTSIPGSGNGENESNYAELDFNTNKTYPKPTPNTNNLVKIAKINHDATKNLARDRNHLRLNEMK
jgi:hypothetical protein